MSELERPERLAIGQLIGNLLRLFRSELAVRGEGAPGTEGLRPAHLQVFGSIKAGGSRLTQLADSSGLSLSAMAELIDSLESLGYVKRVADPSDGRAKLVCLTDSGWQAIKGGRRLIQEIEADWAAALDEGQFELICLGLQELLDRLDPSVSAGYVAPPDG